MPPGINTTFVLALLAFTPLDHSVNINRLGATIDASGTGSNAIVINGPEFVGGKSTITNDGTINAGQDAIVGTAFDEDVINTGTITGNLNLGDGTNTVNSTGAITGDITTGAGNDTITSTNAISGNVSMGAGTSNRLSVDDYEALKKQSVVLISLVAVHTLAALYQRVHRR